jgi:hypothetical protein
MAASLDGSCLTDAAAQPSGRATEPVPRAGLPRTKVAISSETPSGPEGCGETELSRPGFPSPGVLKRTPERLPPVLAASSVKPAPERLEPDGTELSRTGLARPGPANGGPPCPGTAHSTASPSGGKPAADRIDVDLQRIGSWTRVQPARLGCHGWPQIPAGVTLNRQMPAGSGFSQTNPDATPLSPCFL